MSVASRAALLLLPLSGALGVAEPASAQTEQGPTFYADALPVFYENCVSCHQPAGPNVGGLVAPMSLMRYEDARRWATRIKHAIETGYMPPWGAAEQHQGEFKGERYLDREDRETLIAWVDAGAPEGNPSDAPSQAELDALAASSGVPESGWWIGQPDLIVQIEEPVAVADDVEDWQPTFHMPVVEGTHTQAQWVSKAELQPGGPWVHHIVSSHMGVGVPGRGPFTFPEGWGILLPEDPYITVNMHYHKDTGPGTAVVDQTRAGFDFYEPGDVIDYVVDTDINMQREFRIPAGDPNYVVTKERPFTEDTYLLSMGPHMHYRGKAMKYELEYPDGRMETILDVPNYHFDWQFLYEYEEPRFIPAGSKLHMTWWFDNSANNPWNPDPTIDVTYGEATTEEMANARIYFAPARPQGIVVGEPIPADILQRAQDAEARRRQAGSDVEPPPAG